jgi:integrase
VSTRNFLLAAQGTGYEAFFQLEVTTGLRLGEMFGLKWADLDWTTRKLQVRRQVYRVKGKGLVFAEVKTKASRRNVIIGNATLRKIQEHYDNQQILRQTVGDKWHDLDLIFLNSVGNPMEHANLLKIFKEGLRKAGLPDMRFHDLRHTAATLMLMNGTNPKIVQERLGHSDISMTLNTYSHVLPSMQDEAADKLDELVTMVEVGVELPKVVQPAVSSIRQNNRR